MTRQSISVVIAGFFTVFIAYSIRYGYGMLLPGMIKTMGISKTSAGTIYASYFFSYTLCSPLLGWLADRYNIKIILTAFTSLLGTGALMMAFATTVFNAGIFFALCGMGHAACWAPVMAMVQRSVPDKKRGTALGLTTMGSGMGIAAWSLILPVIVPHYSWRAGWMGMGICGLCIAGLNWILVRDGSEKKEGRNMDKAPEDMKDFRESQGTLPKPTYGTLLRDKRLWFIGLAYSLVGFSVLVPYTFLSTYATEQLDFSLGTSTGFFTMIALSGLLGKIVLGPLSDALGRIWVMMICGILLGTGCLGMGLCNSIFMIHLFCLFFGFGFGAVWPLYAAAAPDFFPPKVCGSVIGLWTVFMGIGSIVSPVICGWSIDLSGGYLPTFIMGTACAAGSVILLFPMVRGNSSYRSKIW